MILGFSTKFPKGKGILSGRKTLFPEKIIRSIQYLEEYKKMTLFDLLNEQKKEEDWIDISDFQDLKPKKHTIREDSKNRWKIGNVIDFFIDVRTKNMFRFAPKLAVKSIQSIEITYDEEICEAFAVEPVIFIDKKPIHLNDYDVLAENDGFKDSQEFCHWFNEDFKGKIIHWTNLKY